MSPAPDPRFQGWRLEHSYAGLPAVLHRPAPPTPVAAPRLVCLNRSLASRLGLDPDTLATDAGAAIFAGNALPPGASPLAQAYAGHQYGHFTVLGDGRALLLGEQRAPDGSLFDVQLKGAGPTAYSRRGDGRAALGPMLREYLISEAMHALGVPTTRSLAVVATGEPVWRQPGELPGAVLTRVASSHLRVGTFEYAATHGGRDSLQALVRYTLHRHFPDQANDPAPAEALLRGATLRQAELIAHWMLLGFIHGVMNTDNMALSGETIDYGPCAFMNTYDPATVYSSIDTRGRYAFGNQPPIAHWNLSRLAEALLPLLDAEEAQAIERAEAALGGFGPRFEQVWLDGMRARLGLFDEEPEDKLLISDLLRWMYTTKADYTLTLAHLASPRPELPGAPCETEPGFAAWRDRWQARLARQPHSTGESEARRRAATPAFIPRNHLVEAALSAAEAGDLEPFNRMLEVLSRPFDHARTDADAYRLPPPDEAGYHTFCGT